MHSTLLVLSWIFVLVTEEQIENETRNYQLVLILKRKNRIASILKRGSAKKTKTLKVVKTIEVERVL